MDTTWSALIIDDDPGVRQSMRLCLEADNARVMGVATSAGALEALDRGYFDVIFLDLWLQSESGLTVLPEILRRQPGIGVVVITAFASFETAVEAMRLGAVDYLPKPFTPEQVRHAVAGQRDAMTVYYRRVNPALRQAVADCARIRESNFRSMQLAAILARDEAHRATILVTIISAVALVISTVVALALARSILHPIQELTNSVEALRAGDFGRRVPVVSDDELGSLAVGFNRMAETLAEFRRSNLSEVLRAKETLEATIATLPDAVLVIDPEGRIVTPNPLARSVLQATGAAGASSIEELPFPAHSLTALHAALRGESSTQVRAEFSRTFLVSLDGRRRKFILTVLPIPEFRNEQFGAVAILYDVTDFARLDELRTELIAVASHELKTPLTTLRMNLLLLGEKAENLTARQHEILATAALGCHELASTIDELLDLTRIEAGQLRLTRDSVDLYAVIDRAIASLGQRFEDAEVKLHVGGNGKPAFLLGDPARLAMVFTNLLSNALKYTPRGGTVSIATSMQNAGNGGKALLQIAVTDSGPGVPPAFRERIFDKFFRVEQQTIGDQSGTWGAGIGLYLCRQIVEAHGGVISCEAGENGFGNAYNSASARRIHRVALIPSPKPGCPHRGISRRLPGRTSISFVATVNECMARISDLVPRI